MCGRRKIRQQHSREDSDETPRLHEVERRPWGSGDAEATIASARASENGFQGIRCSTSRLSNRGGDGESGQETRGRHQWAALGPDVSVDATGRRERDHRADADRCDPDVACQRGINGPHCRRHQRRQHAIPVQEHRARGKNDGWADRAGAARQDHGEPQRRTGRVVLDGFRRAQPLQYQETHQIDRRPQGP